MSCSVTKINHEAYMAGADAHDAGASLMDNPFKFKSIEYVSWKAGWEDADYNKLTWRWRI